MANRAMRAPLARSALADLVVGLSIGVHRCWAWGGVDAGRFVALRVLLARRFASASDRKGDWIGRRFVVKRASRGDTGVEISRVRQ